MSFISNQAAMPSMGNLVKAEMERLSSASPDGITYTSTVDATTSIKPA